MRISVLQWWDDYYTLATGTIVFRLEALGDLEIFVFSTKSKRTVCNWLSNDYSRRGVVQKIIRLCHPVDATKSSEGKAFLYFILVNAEKLLEMVKYSLGRNDDGMTNL